MNIHNDRFEEWTPPAMTHGEMTKWNWVVYHPQNLKLGRKTDIGAFTAIFAHHGVEIGDEAQIGSHCSIYSLNTIDNVKGKVVIEAGACVGSHSTVLPGVTIGAGAKIGAHSLVNKDIPAGAIAFGVPCRIIKK